MKKFARLVVIFGCWNVLGCQTYSKVACEKMDWLLEGYKTADVGQTREAGLRDLQHGCGNSHGIEPNVVLFDEGYRKGLAKYCTAENGRHHGSIGGEYRYICDKESEPGFLSGYLPSKLEFLSQSVVDLREQNEKLKSENSVLSDEVARLRNSSSF
jgi:hypothetical protein